MSKNSGRSPARSNGPNNLPNPRRVREDIVQWEGPVPPPQVIEAYERLVPGSAQIMWGNFDEQSRHRRDLERDVVTGSEMRANRGQILAACLLALAMTFGLLIALFANAAAGASVIGTVMVSGAAIYVVGGRQQPPQEPKKDDGGD